MDKKSEKTPPPTGTSPAAGDGAPAGDAFDIWLHRHLHRLYDDVMREPLTPDLLRLIESDRDSREV